MELIRGFVMSKMNWFQVFVETFLFQLFCKRLQWSPTYPMFTSVYILQTTHRPKIVNELKFWMTPCQIASPRTYYLLF